MIAKQFVILSAFMLTSSLCGRILAPIRAHQNLKSIPPDWKS